MRDVIEKIINTAVNAPSGNNSQPWRFEVEENKISLWNLPDRDKFLFNYQQRGSFIANGAIIENILIASSANGYQTQLVLFPKENDDDLIAEITLEKSVTKYKYDNLYPFILKRTTNRKPYKISPLKNEDYNSIRSFIETLDVSYSTILLEQNSDKISKLSKDFSMADRLIFENHDIHQAFFSKVSWTREEEKKRGIGLYVGTKELSPVVKFLFKNVFSKWSALKILNLFHISEKGAKKREMLYKNCSAIGLVVARGDSPRDFVETGRTLQLFWLTITSLGLSFQPVSAGLLYIGQRLQKETPKEFSPKQIEFIKAAYQDILEIFDDLKLIPTFSFRIGYAEPPTASSIKKQPEIIYINEPSI